MFWLPEKPDVSAPHFFMKKPAASDTAAKKKKMIDMLIARQKDAQVNSSVQAGVRPLALKVSLPTDRQGAWPGEK